jgi:hypothetical protein
MLVKLNTQSGRPLVTRPYVKLGYLIYNSLKVHYSNFERICHNPNTSAIPFETSVESISYVIQIKNYYCLQIKCNLL